jgi:ubiquinol-cytochrome c reductase cytochrome c1 subunit
MRMRSALLAAAFAAAVAGFTTQRAAAAEGAPTPPAEAWSFNGIFGTYDRGAVQRGFQVYEGVCHNCHSAKYLAFRNLEDVGLSDDAVKAIAANFQVTDGPNDSGDMFQRPARPSDRMPSPFPNEPAARAANGGALPPDLSLMAKAREGGPDYIYSILTGFADPPPDVKVPEGMNYNLYFPGHMIAMPPPLSEGAVTYDDGTKATVGQMASDVSQFLMWMAEPKLEARKQTGVKVLLFLVVLIGLFYAYKRKVWADLH